VTDRHAQRRQAGEVRRRAEQLRLAEEAKARRRRTAVVAGAAVAVLVLVVLVGIFVQSNRGSTTASGGPTPANLVAGGVVVGAAAPVTVTV
jgi:hypothetical protein